MKKLFVFGAFLGSLGVYLYHVAIVLNSSTIACNAIAAYLATRIN